MFTLILTTLIFVYDGQTDGQDFTELLSVSTYHVEGFATRELCEAAAEEMAGTVLNAERQAVCVSTNQAGVE